MLTKNLSIRFTAAIVAGVLALAGSAFGSIEPGFNANTLSGNDDGYVGPVAIGFNANYFGTTYSQLWVNNNGNVTFGSGMSTYTPFGLTGALGKPIIAPFFADVDTRTSNPVKYGPGTFGGNTAFGVTWNQVGYYQTSTDRLNTFQLLLVDRSDIGPGDFDICFNYGQIQWETGDASGGSGGLGGSSAVVGYSNGTGDVGTNYQVPGSGVNGAFLDGGPNSLSTIGRMCFEVRNGEVTPIPPVPTPSAFLLGAIGLGCAGAVKRRSQRKKA